MAKHARTYQDSLSEARHAQARSQAGRGERLEGDALQQEVSRYSRSAYGTDGPDRYSRESYGSAARRNKGPINGYHKHLETKKRKTRRRRVVSRIAIVVAVLLAVLVILGGWYLHLLNRAISLDDSEGREAAAGLLEGATASEPYYTLIIGSDTRDMSQYDVGANEVIEDERSDVIMLARIDEKNSQVTLLSIPRDTPWVNEDGQILKMNEAYSNRGPAGIISAVEQISGVNVAHYVQLRFAGFQELVDSLGGITVDVPVAISRKDALTGEKIEIDAGKQTLNGQQALIFARARHEYGDDQESKRQGNQRVIVKAIVDAIQDKPFYELPKVILDTAACVGTDMSATEIIRLALAFKDDFTLYGAGAPYKGDFNEALGGMWLCYDDKQGWNNVMSLVDSGEDPSGISYVGDVAYIAGTDQTVVIE